MGMGENIFGMQLNKSYRNFYNKCLRGNFQNSKWSFKLLLEKSIVPCEM